MKLLQIILAKTLLALALFSSGCATEPNLYTGDTGYYGYTWQQELQLGQKADGDIVKQMGLYADDDLSAYVDRLGQRLLSESAMKQPDAPELYRNTEFTFRVLNSPVVNAFALPGGYVYVTRGLLAHVQNEAQLAVVIGHEITHVEARHASKQALKQQWGQIGLLAGAIIGEQVAENKEFARQALDLGSGLFQLATLKYGRDAERESDFHGVAYAAKSGYDTNEAAEFFNTLKRISERSGQSIPSWMSSHPDPGEREATIKSLSKKSIDADHPRTIGELNFLNQIEGLIVGDNPREGFARANAFFHPAMGFQFDVPEGWQIRNEATTVYALEPNSQAMLAFQTSSSGSALAAVQALQQKLSIQLTRSQEQRINDLPAVTIEGLATAESGSIPITFTAIEFREDVFTFLGYGEQASFPSHRIAINQAASSFRQLEDPAILNIQPNRLEIVRANRQAPFSAFLPDKLPTGTDAQDWAIMNQRSPDETVEKGELLKLPSS